MGIHALPDTTVRTIGATQVLTDPAALVKELVDNALDAHATSISVEIHHNTLDVIKVSDNGHGVPPEDRPLVAKRYCTSKLSNYDDLKAIGGSSLGFRGEALASAAELSGSLTISTRIEGQQVGAALKINQQGEVIAEEKASLLVGTCVKITDFIKANPVRRQLSLKNADNCMKNIKRCLQTYAFARPHVRYSLRILKSKANKSDWIYAPKVDGNAEDAAMKLVGSACASQCLWSVLEHDGFTFQALLPRSDANASKISTFGLFISVDCRPVSAARGHFKQVGKVYREALKSAGSHLEDVKDPFLYLEIICPPEAYDINIEPAKDDVAFVDPSKVIEGLKKLFSAVYTPSPQAENSTSGVDIQHATEADESFLSMEQNTFVTPSRVNQREDFPVHGNDDNGSLVDDELAPVEHARDQLPPEPRAAFRTSMYGFDEDLDLPDAEEPLRGDRAVNDLEELRLARKDVTVNNPWVLAKLNGSMRRSIADQAPLEHDHTRQRQALPRTGAQYEELQQARPPTPRRSSPRPLIESPHHSDHIADVPMTRKNNFASPSRLPQPQVYTPIPSSDMYGLEDVNIRNDEHVPPNYNYELTPHHDEPSAGTPLEAIPDVSTRPRGKKQSRLPQANKPFVPPLKKQGPRDSGQQHDPGIVVDRPRRRQNHQDYDRGPPLYGELGDLVEDPRPLTPPRRNRDIRDLFSRREADPVPPLMEPHHHLSGPGRDTGFDQENEAVEAVNSLQPSHRHDCGFVRASEVTEMNADLASPNKPSAAPPPRRRRTSERRALQSLSTNAPIARMTDKDEEYRPNTSTRTASRRQSSHKLGRTKSSKLPLERIPDGQGTQNLTVTAVTSARGIAKLAGSMDEERSLLEFNQPAVNFDSVFKNDPPNLEALTGKLHSLLEAAAPGSDADVPRALAANRLLHEVGEAFARAWSP